MNFKRPLILASSSPRRQFLLNEIGFTFTVKSPDIDESFPSSMAVEKVPSWLAGRKAAVIDITDEVVIAADTVVILEGSILNKPVDRADALRMLRALSGTTHTVVTAVCIRSKSHNEIFDDVSEVTFRQLTDDQISFYVDHFNPLDKAGSYGAQDCLPPGVNPCSAKEIEFLKSIGKIDLIEKSISRPPVDQSIIIIDKIVGSYFNVMGLPIEKLFKQLSNQSSESSTHI